MDDAFYDLDKKNSLIDMDPSHLLTSLLQLQLQIQQLNFFCLKR